MSRCHRILPPLALGLVLGLSGCKEITGFVDITKHTERILDASDMTLGSKTEKDRRVEFRVVVRDSSSSNSLRMVHPAFEGRWNFTDPEKPIDFYVINATVWDDTTYHLDRMPPSSLPDSLVRWSSIMGAVEGLGALRAKEMHMHPAPGSWVVVLYNSTPGADVKAEFSAEIDLTYFR